MDHRGSYASCFFQHPVSVVCFPRIYFTVVLLHSVHDCTMYTEFHQKKAHHSQFEFQPLVDDFLWRCIQCEEVQYLRRQLVLCLHAGLSIWACIFACMWAFVLVMLQMTVSSIVFVNPSLSSSCTPAREPDQAYISIQMRSGGGFVWRILLEHMDHIESTDIYLRKYWSVCD